MRQMIITLTVLGLASFAPEIRLQNSRLEFRSAHAQMFSPEPIEVESGSGKTHPGAASSLPSQSKLESIAASLQRQSANLLIAIMLAAMLLILIGGNRVLIEKRRNDETEPLCKCGLRRRDCAWCRQGGS